MYKLQQTVVNVVARVLMLLVLVLLLAAQQSSGWGSTADINNAEPFQKVWVSDAVNGVLPNKETTGVSLHVHFTHAHFTPRTHTPPHPHTHTHTHTGVRDSEKISVRCLRNGFVQQVMLLGPPC
jgi:hypothetical protein